MTIMCENTYKYPNVDPTKHLPSSTIPFFGAFFATFLVCSTSASGGFAGTRTFVCLSASSTIFAFIRFIVIIITARGGWSGGHRIRFISSVLGVFWHVFYIVVSYKKQLRHLFFILNECIPHHK
jgi:hypothetical protein